MRKSTIAGFGILFGISAAATADDLPLKLVSVTAPVHPGGVVTLIIQTLPDAMCEGNRQGHYGNSYSIKLQSQTARADGLVRWQWSVRSGNHPIGIRGVHVTCVAGERHAAMDTTFDVQ